MSSVHKLPRQRQKKDIPPSKVTTTKQTHNVLAQHSIPNPKQRLFPAYTSTFNLNHHFLRTITNARRTFTQQPHLAHKPYYVHTTSPMFTQHYTGAPTTSHYAPRTHNLKH
eukprot:gene3169-2151_t